MVATKKIDLPGITTDLARFYGHVLSDGHLGHGRVVYVNNCKELVDNFVRIVNKYFGETRVIKEGRLAYRCTFHSKELVRKVKETFCLLHVLDWSMDCQKSFLAACFDDEGSISKSNIISIVQKDRIYIEIIRKLLSNLGIESKHYIMYNKHYEEVYHAIRIPVRFNELFYNNIKLLHSPKNERLRDYILKP